MTNGTKNVKAGGRAAKQPKRDSTRMTPRQAYLAMVQAYPRGNANIKKGLHEGGGTLFDHYDALKEADEYDCVLACASRICMIVSRVRQGNIRYFKELAGLYLAFGRPDRAIAVVKMAVKKGAKKDANCAESTYELLMIRVDALDLMNRETEAVSKSREAMAFAAMHNIKSRPRLPIRERRDGALPKRYAIAR